MKKHLQTQLSRINAARASAVGALSLMAASAHAEIPANVTAKLGEIPGDVVTIGALVLIAIAAIFAIKLLRRAM